MDAPALTQAPPARMPAARGQAPALVLLRVALVPLLGFVSFGLGLVFLRPDRIPLYALTIATATLILMTVVVDRALPRERRNLLLSIFSFSYTVFFVLPVFVFYLGDAGYHPDMSPNGVAFTPRVVADGMLAVFLGFVMLLVGYVIPLGTLAARVVPRMQREWSPEAALGVAMVMIPLGWVVILGGQFGLIPERLGSGVLGAIAMGASYGIGLIALCYQRYRAPLALLMLAVVIPPTMIFNFFTSSKILFLMPLIMIAVVHIIVTRRLRLWWIVGFIAVMAVFYPISQVYRDYLYGNELRAVQVIASPKRAIRLLSSFASTFEAREYLSTGIETTARRLDGLGILSVVVRDTGVRVPYQNGATLAYIPAAYVPRILWPGKPKFTTGQWVTDNFGPGPHIASSTGCTWMGELYFNFGWTGLIVGMTLIGAWFRFLQESFMRIDSTIPAMLAGVIAILTLSSGVGGGMLGATNTVVFNISPIIFAHIVVRLVTARPRRLPPPL